jgi:hypothetical protein
LEYFQKVCEEIKIMIKEMRILKRYLKNSGKSFSFSCRWMIRERERERGVR